MSDNKIGFIKGDTKCEHEFIWRGCKDGADWFACSKCSEHFEQYTDCGSGG